MNRFFTLKVLIVISLPFKIITCLTIPAQCSQLSHEFRGEKVFIYLKSVHNNLFNCSLDFYSNFLKSCEDQNTFIFSSDVSDLQEVTRINCEAPFALGLDYDGVIPHRTVDLSYPLEPYTIEEAPFIMHKYKLELHLYTEPHSSGKYTFFDVQNHALKIDIFLFIETKTRPFLFNEGDTLKITLDASKNLILPCRSFNWNSTLSLQKGLRLMNDSELFFDPRIGFQLENFNLTSEEMFGAYICYSGNSTHPGEVNSFIRFIVHNGNESLGDINTIDANMPLIKIGGNGTSSLDASCDSKTAINFINVFSNSRTVSQFQTDCLKGSKDNECRFKKDGLRDWRKETKTINNIWRAGLLICSSSAAKTIVEYFIGLDQWIYAEFRVSNLPIKALMTISFGNMALLNLDTLYVNKTYQIMLHFVEYLLPYYKPPKCELKDVHNKTLSTVIASPYVQNDWDGSDIFWIEEVKIPGIQATYVTCQMFYWNMEDSKIDVIVAEKLMHVEEQKFPYILNTDTQHLFQLNDIGRSLSCISSGVPLPNISWTVGTAMVPADLMGLTEAKTNGTVVLGFPPIQKFHEANYTCFAENEVGFSNKTFYVRVSNETYDLKPSENDNYGVIIGIPVSAIMFVLVFIIIFIFWSRKFLKFGVISKAEIEEFFNGISQITCLNINADSSPEYFPCIPYDHKYEVPYDDFFLDEDNVLGSGEFGIVYYGKVRDIPVAVKTVKKVSLKDHVHSLLSELKLMIYIGAHKHIPLLIGAHTKSISKGLVFMFIELCPMGNLQKFIRSNRDCFIYTNTQNERYISVDDETSPIISEKHLFTWALQIAIGMDFLESKKVIHGDLAARNILLINKSMIKITDFGLSRKLYQYTTYVKKSEAPLPWRWMAIESLKNMTFSTKSDVWAYGVTLWEIFALGEIPYGGVTWSLHFVEELKDGFRLQRPDDASEEIYRILLRCWSSDPIQRPSFIEMAEYFENLI